MKAGTQLRPLHPIALLTAMLLAMASLATAQTLASIKKDELQENQVKKTLRWGVAGNIMWSTIKGNDLPANYFVKPGLGISLRAEYYLLPFLGVGAGVGYQQRGAGVINPDYSGGAASHPWIVDKNGNQGDPDSTHLEKLRFNTLEMPLSLLFKTPHEVIRGIRLSGSAGLIYIYNFESTDVMESIMDGIHKSRPVTGQYLRHDIGWQVSAGVDISSAPNGNLFQIHLLYNEGLGNVFAAGQGTGTQVCYGIRLTCFF
ncbi:MAG: outer membrane beta-barrel protein [Cyclobacteriaceae bacterium]|nr:outer membrane beta-barrel protein [Cyclobacteriaceae bacterium]